MTTDQIYIIVEQGQEEDDPTESYEVVLGYCTYDFDAKAEVEKLMKARTDDHRRQGIWYGFRPCPKIR